MYGCQRGLLLTESWFGLRMLTSSWPWFNSQILFLVTVLTPGEEGGGVFQWILQFALLQAQKQNFKF